MVQFSGELGVVGRAHQGAGAADAAVEIAALHCRVQSCIHPTTPRGEEGGHPASSRFVHKLRP